MKPSGEHEGEAMESAMAEAQKEELAGMLREQSSRVSHVSTSRAFMSALLAGADFLSLLLAGSIAVGVRALLKGVELTRFLSFSTAFNGRVYLQLIPLLLLFLVFYASRRLYPSVGLNRVEEFRQLTISTSLVAALYALILFLTQRGLIYSRSVFALFVILALFTVPLGRVLVRWILVKASLWGVPVGVVGHGPATQRTVDFLAGHPTLGFKPEVWFRKVKKNSSPTGAWQERDFSSIDPSAPIPELSRLDTLILVQEETPYSALNKLVRVSGRYSFHIMIMPDFPELGSLWVNPVDLGGVPALKIQNNLASPWQRAQKRVSDLILAGLISVFVFPLYLLIALAVKIDSRGPVLFVQERIGKDGERFDMLKFRTMYVDAEQRLRQILASDASKKAEWEQFQKLAGDPRVTRVGRFLRSFSLDELPQFWNVLNGTMSLVGPRPFFPDQEELYGYAYETYVLVRPGITGIWQVNGRSTSSFRQRSEMDEYYVRNWSVWLDLYILARTPLAVLSRRGAY